MRPITAAFLPSVVLAVSVVSVDAQLIQLAHDQEFGRQRTFCVEVSGTLHTEPDQLQPKYLLKYSVKLKREKHYANVWFELNGELRRHVMVVDNWEGEETL